MIVLFVFILMDLYPLHQQSSYYIKSTHPKICNYIIKQINNNPYNNQKPKKKMITKTQISSAKSFSLPKLSGHINSNKQSSSLSYKKPLKQFHKVNWSVAPKCLIEGHQGQLVLYVCVKKQCLCATRLICQKCFYGIHAEHNKNFLAVDQIKSGKVNSLRYWPFESEYKQIFQFIKSHNSYIQNLLLDIKSTFQNLLQSITQTIIQTKQKYIDKVRKFYTKQTKKQQYINQLAYGLEKLFNFKEIQFCVRQVFNKEIRHDVFIKKMNTIINDKVYSVGNLEGLAKMRRQFMSQEYFKGKDMVFDKVYFLKKHKILTKNITQMQNSIIQQNVTKDEAAIGIETIITQTVQYLIKNSQGLYPLIYDQKYLEDGTYYNGFTWKGNRTLLGLRDYKNGYKYYGEWRNNCRNGWGVYQNKQIGYKYAGNWKQDKKNGFGKQITSTYIYEGNFVNDKKEGFGTMRQDGVRYDITWKNDKKNGKGKRYDVSGEVQVYYLNGVQSQVKGSSVANGQGQKRDVNFLARMFAGGGNSQ